VHVDFEFDQSIYVTSAIRGLAMEGGLGAVLTALTVLLFLRNWRSALIVVLTIPLSILSALIALRLAGQTINIMTLSGLALAVGILVDEATVAIEKIHTHLAMGKGAGRAVVDAMREVMQPRLLAMLCILAVFTPTFFLVGISRALFPPLALAVGFSMIASYLISTTLVPVMATRLFRSTQPADHAHAGGLFERVTLIRGGRHRLADPELRRPHPDPGVCLGQDPLGHAGLCTPDRTSAHQHPGPSRRPHPPRARLPYLRREHRS
jgi:multidrug efflux pump subunit AcrB